MPKERKILFSFDVEEFDLPVEYKHHIGMDEQMATGKKGLDATLAVISQHNMNCTMFTTANFAYTYPLAIKQLASKYEIGSHAYYHSSFKNTDLLQSRLLLQETSGKKISGFRMPRMKPVSMKDVIDAGYEYDSSVNPSFIPGRYNNFHLPRTIYKEEGISRMPVSVTPNARIPLFWLTFKNFPYLFFRSLALRTLKNDGYLCLLFHPWEFTDLSKYRIPFFTKKNHGIILQDKLHRLIKDLSKEGELISIDQYLASQNRS